MMVEAVKYWDSDASAWKYVNVATDTEIPVGSTPPLSPEHNDLWIDTDAAEVAVTSQTGHAPDPSAQPDNRILKTVSGVLAYSYHPLTQEYLDVSDFYYDSGLGIIDSTESHGKIGFTSLPVPFSGVIIDKLATYVTTAGSADSVVRMGLYSDDGGKPGALLVDGGTVATDTTGYKDIAIADFSVTEPKNLWLAVHRTGTTAAEMPVTSHTTRPQTVMGVVLPYRSGYMQRFNTTVVSGGYLISEPTEGPLPAVFPGGVFDRYVNIGGVGMRRA